MNYEDKKGVGGMPIIPGLSRAFRIGPYGLQPLVKIQAQLLRGAHRYFDKEGFVEIVVPRMTKITSSCENIDTLFETNFFGQRGYLMQTGQLFLEVLISDLDKVWCNGPSFRAEAKVDNRHLTEFTLLEMEFCGDFEQLLSRIEGLLSEMIRMVLEHCDEELDNLKLDKRRLLEFRPPFQRITYDQAVEALKINWGEDLESKHEEFLVLRCGNNPLFVTHHPEQIKSYNYKTNPDNPKLVNSADLILPFGGEAVGAAEREFKYEQVYERLKRSNMLSQLERRGGSINDFDWYLNYLRENGSVPHAGGAVGLNRVMQFVMGSCDIRESTLFPSNSESLM